MKKLLNSRDMKRSKKGRKKMMKYQVYSEFNCSEEVDTFEKALEIFEQYKDELMSEGVSENNSYVEIAESDDDFEDHKIIKKVVAVRDHERMKKSTPQEEGYEWTFWAKWLDVTDNVKIREC